MTDLWSEFAGDPRDPESAAMRASDADREIVVRELGSAFSDGRLDHEEYDERLTAAYAVKSLGEIAPLLHDLVPLSATASSGLARVGDDVHAQAIAAYQKDRREGLMGFLGPSLICWIIWALVMPGDFAWPLIVTAATALPLVRLSVQREDAIAKHEQEILAQQADAAAGELPAGE